jgi:hypothetical protein
MLAKVRIYCILYVLCINFAMCFPASHTEFWLIQFYLTLPEERFHKFVRNLAAEFCLINSKLYTI